MISPALASILRSGRADFNARFAAARRVHPELDPGVFGQFLESSVDGLAQAIDKTRPDRLGDVIMAAYDVGLELVGQRLAGPGARVTFIEDAWRRIFANAAEVIAMAPGRLIPAACNAVYQLSLTPGAGPELWIESMEKLSSQCSTPDEFLKLGIVCGWRAGLAEYRSGAVAAGDALPDALVVAAVNAKLGSAWANIRAQLLANPWYDPSKPANSSGIRVVARIGAFKGFGGLFTVPPLVVSVGEQFVVHSDGESWFLTADAFGATFHRATLQEFEAAKFQSCLPDSLKISGSSVVCNGRRFELPELGEFTSVAANANTLALTSRLTHSVTLVALQ